MNIYLPRASIDPSITLSSMCKVPLRSIRTAFTHLSALDASPFSADIAYDELFLRISLDTPDSAIDTFLLSESVV